MKPSFFSSSKFVVPTRIFGVPKSECLKLLSLRKLNAFTKIFIGGLSGFMQGGIFFIPQKFKFGFLQWYFSFVGILLGDRNCGFVHFAIINFNNLLQLSIIYKFYFAFYKFKNSNFLRIFWFCYFGLGYSGVEPFHKCISKLIANYRELTRGLLSRTIFIFANTEKNYHL